MIIFCSNLLQIFTVIEAMADGAVKQGVPRQMALQFAAQTVLGAAKTVIQTEKHPAILRDEVNFNKKQFFFHCCIKMSSRNDKIQIDSLFSVCVIRCVHQVDQQ